MASFSLTEKLAVTGAFLAVVALMVGTEDDPGLVIDGQEAVKELRPVAPTSAPLAQAPPLQAPLPAESTPPPAALPSEPTRPPEASEPAVPARQDVAEGDDQFSPELGRVPLDFSKGPPPG